MIIEYKGKKPNISPTAFIAPTAVLIGDVTVGDEASIWWGAVLRSDQNANPIVVGARTSVQDNCVIHSGEAPTIIEEDCTIGHGAINQAVPLGTAVRLDAGEARLTFLEGAVRE